ncbi:MFS transporter [Cutibacterium avidum]|uniref:MFS transporter n=1 Tax=Cutibacterium avidum TaxID=33010 RepID=UPI00083E9222|nr:MFS transporter [Cutibacterium avidum]AOG28078.1 hypothetical protein BFS79_05580 [Cutibacterium avidum]MCO6677479.1 MFS transporter [Cutibacterium avidum]MDU5414746.1 MFS transporter [Cutibacterium avidum]MDU5420140.1 MFS transporter [Cutibacterium avidum]QQY12898.1 MFS transporter [Cutibacterium avidum]
MTPLSRRTKNLLLTAAAFQGAGDFMFGAVYVIFLRSIPLDGRAIGFVLALATGVSLVVEAPSGAMADRYGHRRILLAGLLSWAVGLIALSFASSALAAGGALLLWTIGMALQSGTVWPILLETVTEEDKQDAIAQYSRQSQSVHWMASFLGAMAVLVLGARCDMRFILRTAAGLLVLALVVCLWLPKDVRPSERQPVMAVLRSSFGWCASRTILPLVIASGLSTVCMTGLVVTWQPRLAAAGVPLEANGAVLGALTIAAAVGSFCTKFVKVSRPQGAFSAMAGISACFLVVALAGGTLWVALAGYVVAEFFLGGMFVELGAWQQEMLPDDIRNGGFSALSTISLVVAVVVNAGMGELWQRFGLAVTIGCVALVIVVVILITVLVRPALVHRTVAQC